MNRKLLVRDARGQRELLLVGTMAVGRDPRCDISDADPMLSRRHAEFVATARGVLVRDLSSRNGIQVNGVKVPEATLSTGDIVRVGGLTITYVEEVLRAGGLDDGTAVTHGPLAGEPSARTPSGLAADVATPDDDKTRVVMRPPVAGTPPAGDRADHGHMPAGRWPASGAPPVADVADGERARLVSAPVAPASVPPRPAPARAAAARPRQPAAAAQPVTGQPRKARVARIPWDVKVLVQILLLAAAIFIVTAIPLSMARARAVSATGLARATALVNWLAADARARVAAGGDMSGAADAVGREPGVIAALVMTPDGLVQAPAARASETFAPMPGTALKPSDVLRLRHEVHADLIEMACPVSRRDGARVAVAWLTFRAAAAGESESVFSVLGPSILISLVVAVGVAVWMRRSMLKPLAQLNEDVDLAVSGQLEAVSDPMGARPVRDLADTLNYLVTRMRAAPAAEPQVMPHGARPAARRAETPARGDASQAPVSLAGRPAASPSAPTGDARIVVDATFRITEASPACLDLIGVGPESLVGKHLVDAMTDQGVADAILHCVGALPSSGEQHTTVTPEARHVPLSMTVSRSGRDQPVTITFRVAPPGGAA